MQIQKYVILFRLVYPQPQIKNKLKSTQTIVSANNNATTRQARGGPKTLPCGRPRRGRQRVVRGLPVPRAQGNTCDAIARVLLNDIQLMTGVFLRLVNGVKGFG